MHQIAGSYRSSTLGRSLSTRVGGSDFLLQNIFKVLVSSNKKTSTHLITSKIGTIVVEPVRIYQSEVQDIYNIDIEYLQMPHPIVG